MPDGIWRGVVRTAVAGGYLVEIPRLSTGRVYGTTSHPLTYPSTLTIGSTVLVGFLENNPDQPVILRAG